MNPQTGHLIVELGFWCVGIAALTLYMVARIDGELEQSRALDRFEALQFAEPARFERADTSVPMPRTGTARMPGDRPIDSQVARIDAQTEAAPDADGNLPIAILRIGAVGLEVPVFEDTSERNLNRGAGWIAGTAAPNAGGNIAIAAHRDGNFRVLKDVQVGQPLELVSLSRSVQYRVTEILIVDPEDVWVLDPTPVDTVTLVTCYPFHFVGSAPRRYIVRAALATEPHHEPASGSSDHAEPSALQR